MNVLPLQLQLFKHWDVNVSPLRNSVQNSVVYSLGLGSLNSIEGQTEFKPLNAYLTSNYLHHNSLSLHISSLEIA